MAGVGSPEPSRALSRVERKQLTDRLGDLEARSLELSKRHLGIPGGSEHLAGELQDMDAEADAIRSRLGMQVSTKRSGSQVAGWVLLIAVVVIGAVVLLATSL